MAIGFVLCSVSIIASLVLGGGTRPGFLGDVILQLLTIPVLLDAVWRHADMSRERRDYRLLLVPALLGLVPALQLVPLPAALWRALPGHDLAVEAFELSAQSLPSLPISVAPTETWGAVLSLIPLLAIFLGTVLLDHADRRRLSLVVIGMGLVSAALGLLQVGQGPASPLRPFEFTSSDDAVGFFANRNHMAALTYSVTLLLGAWLVTLLTMRAPSRKLRSNGTPWTLQMIAALTAFAALIATEAMTRSRTGIALMLVAMAAVFALSVSAHDKNAGRASTRIIVGACALGLFLVMQYALYATVERFAGSDPLKDGRVAIARATIAAAKSYMPWGAGIGSFTSVYPTFEKVEDTMRDTYVNRAHNDILETWLETGVVGPVLLAGFTLWLVTRLVAVWRRGPALGHPADRLLACAAAVILLLLLVHSFLDYPLRTAAMMAVAGYCCGLLVPPRLPTEEKLLDVVGEAAAQQRHRPRRQVVPISVGPVSMASVLGSSSPSAGQDDSSRTPHRVDWPENVHRPAESMATTALESKSDRSYSEDWPEGWLEPAGNDLPDWMKRSRRKPPKQAPDDDSST